MFDCKSYGRVPYSCSKMFEMNENNLCENNPVHPPPIPSHANVLNIDSLYYAYCWTIACIEMNSKPTNYKEYNTSCDNKYMV